MTLYDYIKAHPEIEELPVHDKEYLMESYFYQDILEPQDDWDRAMATIAQKLTVIEEDNYGGYYCAGVTTNLSEVIKKALPKTANLFINNDVDSIMADIENIFSGYVSEQWLTDFAKEV